MNFFVFGLFFIFHIAPTQSTLGCPNGTIEIPDNMGPKDWKCLLFANYAKQYLTAEQTCIANQGHLITIVNGFINAFIAQTATDAFAIGGEKKFWIGVNDLLGLGWTDTDDGAQTIYFDWAPGEPVNDSSGTGCVSVDMTGLWYNDNCFNNYPYICEVPQIEITTPAPTQPHTTIGPKCDEGWTEIDGQCYQLVSKNVTFSAAESGCQSLAPNSHIVSIHDYPTSVKLGYSLLSISTPQAAIGLCSEFYDGTNDPDWFWVDFSPFDYEHWGTNEPALSPTITEYCAVLNFDGSWSSHDASKIYPGYICEKPKQ